MKHYRLNQIAMAVLGALLLIFGTRTLINIAFEEHEPEKPGHEVAGAKHGEEPAGAEKAAGPDLGTLLAGGDAAKGETAAAVCKVCHGFEAGAPSPIGPNLHNVVGRKIASVEGFNYSPALKAKSDETWTYEHIDALIHKPAEFASGTLMAFPGVPDAKQRADVILFLRTKTDNPPPLPEPKAAAPATAEGQAPEAAKPAGPDVIALVVAGDPTKGEAAAAVCKVCHSVDKGAPSPIGPNLYGVVGRDIASVEGFNYSPALKAKEGDWTFEEIDAFMHKPMEFAPGTLMAFPGLPDPKQRGDVLAFLRIKADSPVPLPEAAPAETPAAPAAEEKPAEEPAAPAAEEEPAEEPAAPAAEEKPAEAPAAPAAEEKPAEEPAAPAAEAPAAEPAAPAADADFSEPSTSAQPQPVVPSEAPAEETPVPAAEEAPAAAPAQENASEPATSTQPQPVYPDGAPE
jgi:cytochrome c